MRGLAILLAFLIASCVDPGGSLVEYDRRVADLRRAGQGKAITSVCLSACTMYLSIACVSPGARLGFHAPQRKGGLTRAEKRSWAEFTARHYPDSLRRWYLAPDGPWQRDSMTYLSGSQLIELHGIRECA